MIYLLLLGCPKTPALPPPLFHNPPVEIEAAPHEAFPADPKACPEPMDMQPGSAAPYVEIVQGVPVATCRAQILPERDAWSLYLDAEDAKLWRATSSICHEGRLRDRAYAESVHQRNWTDNEAVRSNTRRIRAAMLWGIAGGFVGGLAFGYGYTQLLVRTTP